jgi:hypothetical protein
MEITHEPLHLDKRRLVQWRIMDLATSFVWITIVFVWTFEHGVSGIVMLPRWMQK